MTILALEFSSAQRSVAVVRHDAGRASFASSEVIESGPGGTDAFGMIERVLAEARIEREQVEVMVVGLGPGSYTGIRVALAIAQGWQLAARAGGMKLLGISSAECLAAQAQVEKIQGQVGVVIDAQRNEFYLAAYDLSANGWKESESMRILTRAEVEARTGVKWILVGPEVARCFPGGRMMFPRAAMLGRLAFNRNDFAAGENLKPIYLRETNFVKAPPVRRTAP